MKCETCKYWKNGVCHKHPPKVITISGDNPYIENNHLITITGWPVTYKDDYCGEWEQQDKVP